MINRDFLMDKLKETGFELSQPEQLTERFDRYAEMLVDWNEKINLTAITAPDEIVIKHFVDSLLLLKAYDVPKGVSMIDVGTGAGFPSVPVAMVRDDIRLTLMDSLNKRINFLKELSKTLGVNAECVHARAEEFGNKPEYREQYDVACARAVAHLRELSEYCLPFVKVGGAFVALKSVGLEQELEEAKAAIDILGGKVERISRFTLPDGAERAIAVIRKIRPTPKKFPRPYGKIKKNPLNKA
ncbi:MAG TPA: 16S rRNA (guanine(527)-N(7))-methyltransferase RsmG [Candidatus Faecivivens stercoripullorum]|uniref:Ribosomal RNA small subunit methyltransferase G n=1 Tax=Candidatus Faecivivens stercoripullorum TaxID=2840805 RepID=A0A9D1H8U5_9FIRM|nr:16S rRNA (guanine(527)-N(7))-methyltransferase RsmG [Candidatus Faecivivens stercoripullorum]